MRQCSVDTTLVHGKKTLMTEFRLRKGSIVPLHSHPHEQTGYLVSGQVKFNSGSEEIVCNPGDSWCIHGDQEHVLCNGSGNIIEHYPLL
ncbi:MAG: cupin domain-containing protein [Desulfobulbaceae bacterium]|nr:cupin domain-containing protein [Desulfobulbaceae bacterium]